MDVEVLSAAVNDTEVVPDPLQQRLRGQRVRQRGEVADVREEDRRLRTITEGHLTPDLATATVENCDTPALEFVTVNFGNGQLTKRKTRQ